MDLGAGKAVADGMRRRNGMPLRRTSTLLTRQLPPEILMALDKAGVRVVVVDGGEIGLVRLVAD